MKNSIAALAFTAAFASLVSGCATRPATGPGSGMGADYVPVVSAPAQTPDLYEADVARCQREARGYPFIKPTEHDEALWVVNGAAMGAVLAATAGNAVAPVVTAGGWTGGGLYGFDYWVYSPQRAAWRAKQETVMLNCMSRRGYVNADPSVTVTWRPIPLNDISLRRTGVDTYNAEKLAKARSCAAMPIANLIDKGPGFERYNVACNGGVTMAVRCEFGNCRAV
ncbi:MAG: hypothetical protein EOO26_08020 [Comamonadaceae bacterium]|nr:MAG: hypothetical protein EOO26_08020 [Comamonadaceae bacterium]